MAIKIFGCIMPLPPGYFLHTDNASPENLEFNRLTPIGFLRIRKFEPIDQDLFDVVHQQQVGQLTIITIRAKKEQLRRYSLTIIHDGQRQLSIIGDDEDWAEPMARYCVDHRM